MNACFRCRPPIRERRHTSELERIATLPVDDINARLAHVAVQDELVTVTGGFTGVRSARTDAPGALLDLIAEAAREPASR